MLKFGRSSLRCRPFERSVKRMNIRVTEWNTTTSMTQKVMRQTSYLSNWLKHPFFATHDRQASLGNLLCLLMATGLTVVFENLAEIFGHNRLQNSVER